MMYTATAEPPTRSPHHMAAVANSSRGEEPNFAWRVLEEIDYGMIVVKPDGALLHANHLARHELALARVLRIELGHIVGCSSIQTLEVMRGVTLAARGRRQMLNLGTGADNRPVAFVPLFEPYDGEPATVLLMLGRDIGTQNLAVGFFSRTHGLTPAEECVLRSLCDGLDVHDIAAAKGVAECTVRSQLRTLREKTNTNSIRLLVQRVAALPPVVPMSLVMNGRGATQSAL